MHTLEQLQKILRYHPRMGVFTWRETRGYQAIQGDIAGHKVNKGYVLITIDGKMYKAHRLVWLFEKGVWPKNEIDHIREDKSINRLVDLREATHGQNIMNVRRRFNNKTGVRGVSWHKIAKKWCARIDVDGHQKYLGVFDTIEQAQAARLDAEDRYHGEFSPDSLTRQLRPKQPWHTPTIVDVPLDQIDIASFDTVTVSLMYKLGILPAKDIDISSFI